MTLDINTLINKAEEIINDPQIGYTAVIVKNVQEVKVAGKVYELLVVLRIKE